MNFDKRPQSLRQIAEQSVSKESFGYALADFEHELARATSRPELLKACSKIRPGLLAAKLFCRLPIATHSLASRTPPQIGRTQTPDEP